jgi:aerobic C4-dicarboxylate transport protein
MIIAPVIFLTVVTGIAGMRDLDKVGRVALKAFAYFLVFSTLALIVGLIVANVVHPGAGMNIDPATLNTTRSRPTRPRPTTRRSSASCCTSSPTPWSAPSPRARSCRCCSSRSCSACRWPWSAIAAKPVLTSWSRSPRRSSAGAHLMKAAPIGAFGAFAFTIGKYGIGSIANLAGLVATFYLTSLFFVVVILGAGGQGQRLLDLPPDPLPEGRAAAGAGHQLVGSGPAQPDREAGKGRLPKSVVGLVVPLGYSFNLDGTNIYMTLAALFIAQATGVHLSLGDQALLLGVAMLSSKGAAGVTGAGFITLAATLSVVPSVPVAGMALILGVDRFMSECRALTNFTGNAVATIVVSRWERGLDVAQLEAALNPDPAALDILAASEARP